MNMNANTAPAQEEWLTIQEVSNRTGRSAASLRMMIKRRTAKGEQLRVKKEPGKRGDNWLFHSSEIERISEHATANVNPQHATRNIGVSADAISFETYDQHRREWEQRSSQLEQGLMMYRYKYEELDKQIRLLPAPVEVVNHKLDELEEKAAALALAENIIQQAQVTQKQYEETMEQLKVKLLEEEQAKATLRRELEMERRPWWRKMMGMK